MKYSLAASFAMAALVGAAPVINKRDMAYSTVTVEEWVTEWSTTTVWDGEEIAAATSTSAGGFYEVQSSAIPSSAAASSTKASSVSSASSASSTPAAPVVPSSISIASSTVAPSSPIIAPSTSIVPSTSIDPATTSTPVPVVPAPSSTSVAPTSTYIAPVVISTTTAAPTSTVAASVAPVVSAAPAPAKAVASTSGGSGTNTGDMTYYDVSVGLTSCGVTGSNSDFLVAMNKGDMANGINPNLNPNCNRYIDIYYEGVGPIRGKVVDTCPVCASGAIDVTDSLFKKVAPNGDGRVHGVSWSWA